LHELILQVCVVFVQSWVSVAVMQCRVFVRLGSKKFSELQQLSVFLGGSLKNNFNYLKVDLTAFYELLSRDNCFAAGDVNEVVIVESITVQYTHAKLICREMYPLIYSFFIFSGKKLLVVRWRQFFFLRNPISSLHLNLNTVKLCDQVIPLITLGQ